MSTIDTTETRPFSVALREGTAVDHADAESNRYLDALLNGDLDAQGYARLVAQHWHVYTALERVSAASRHHPVVAPFVSDDLSRVPSLEADLVHLLGPRWAERAAPVPATTAYVARIARVTDWPGGIVAHHYTRYLGDLSGGLFIGRRVNDLFGFGAGPGASFYRFDRIGDAGAFKERYRLALDAAPWDEAERARIITEARAAYAANIAVFDDLGAELSGSASSE